MQRGILYLCIYLCICLSIYPSVYLSIYLPINRSYLSFFRFFWNRSYYFVRSFFRCSLFSDVFLCAALSFLYIDLVYLAIVLSVYLPIWLCLSIFLSASLFCAFLFFIVPSVFLVILFASLVYFFLSSFFIFLFFLSFFLPFLFPSFI